MVSARETAPTQKFMAIWRSPSLLSPRSTAGVSVAQSDYALCADLVIASEDAVIGTRTAGCGVYLSG